MNGMGIIIRGGEGVGEEEERERERVQEICYCVFG